MTLLNLCSKLIKMKFSVNGVYCITMFYFVIVKIMFFELFD
jgi:hypothetical protein